MKKTIPQQREETSEGPVLSPTTVLRRTPQVQRTYEWLNMLAQSSALRWKAPQAESISTIISDKPIARRK